MTGGEGEILKIIRDQIVATGIAVLIFGGLSFLIAHQVDWFVLISFYVVSVIVQSFYDSKKQKK